MLRIYLKTVQTRVLGLPETVGKAFFTPILTFPHQEGRDFEIDSKFLDTDFRGYDGLGWRRIPFNPEELLAKRVSSTGKDHRVLEG